MAFVAVNLTISQSYQGDESVAQLTLTELTAKAITNGEGVLAESTTNPGKYGCCPGSRSCDHPQIPEENCRY